MPSGPFPPSSRNVSSASVAGAGGFTPPRSRLATALAATNTAPTATPTPTSVAGQGGARPGVGGEEHRRDGNADHDQGGGRGGAHPQGQPPHWAARIVNRRPAKRGQTPSGGARCRCRRLPLRADQRAGGGGDVGAVD